MARRRSRQMRRIRRNIDSTTGEVSDFIETNPVTSAVVALAAGALATSVFKMTVGRPSGEGPEPDAAARPGSRKPATSAMPAKKTGKKTAKKTAKKAGKKTAKKTAKKTGKKKAAVRKSRAKS
jgi:hypothetical protein